MNRLKQGNRNCPLQRFSIRWRSTILWSTATCSCTQWVEYLSTLLNGRSSCSLFELQYPSYSVQYRTETVPTLALWRCSSSWRAPSRSRLPERGLRDRKLEGRRPLESSAARPSTCPRTRPSICTSAPTRLPVRSSRLCWRSSRWWTTLLSSPCLSAGNVTSKVHLLPFCALGALGHVRTCCLWLFNHKRQ